MLYRASFPAALAAALAFCTVPALAATAAQANRPDVADFQHAKISLEEAVAAAEKQSGGRVTDASYQEMNGKSGYAVTALAAGKMRELWVDPQSGQVTPRPTTSTAEANQQALDKAEFSDLHGAKTTLSQAIAMAEQHGSGKAIGAGIEKRNDKIGYNVQLLRDGKLSTVWVDPVSGQIAS